MRLEERGRQGETFQQSQSGQREDGRTEHSRPDKSNTAGSAETKSRFLDRRMNNELIY
jgi:hypothetical protein